MQQVSYAQPAVKPTRDRPEWHSLVDDFQKHQGYASFESLLTILFNQSGQVKRTRLTTDGTTNCIILPVRAIVKDALALNVWRIMLMHNHPSGSVLPSKTDIEQTRHLARILVPLDIQLADHIIVAHGKHFSFRDNGLL